MIEQTERHYCNIRVTMTDASAIAMKQFIPRFGASLKCVHVKFKNSFFLLEEILRAATELEILHIQINGSAVVYMKEMPVLHQLRKVCISPATKSILNLLKEIAPNVTKMEIGKELVDMTDSEYERFYDSGEYEEMPVLIQQATVYYRQLKELALDTDGSFDQDMTNSICGLENLKTLKLKFYRCESDSDFLIFITKLKIKNQLKTFSAKARDVRTPGLLNFENWPSLQHLSISVRSLQPGQDLGNITSFESSCEHGDEAGTIGSMKLSSLKRFKLKFEMPYNTKLHSKSALSNVSSILVGIDRCAPELKDLHIKSHKEYFQRMKKYVKNPANFVNIKRFVFKEIRSDNIKVLNFD
jgi:hypothetical protein